jgi:hypothetical protein
MVTVSGVDRLPQMIGQAARNRLIFQATPLPSNLDPLCKPPRMPPVCRQPPGNLRGKIIFEEKLLNTKHVIRCPSVVSHRSAINATPMPFSHPLHV